MFFSRAAGLRYVDRGNCYGYDWAASFWTIDSAWHDLDLSAICPSGTKLVLLRVKIKSPAKGKYIGFKTKGNTYDYNIAQLSISVINEQFAADLWVVPDVNRVIQYYLSTSTWTNADVLVAGWLI